MFGLLFGRRGHQSREYLRDGRLEDVIALIQVLGLDKHTNRGESALSKLLRQPASGRSWVDVAGRHPEFFRVTDAGTVGLIARLLMEGGEEPRAPTPESINGLVEAAIRIHQGQLQRRQILRVAWAAVALSVIPSLINVSVVLLTRPR